MLIITDQSRSQRWFVVCHACLSIPWPTTKIRSLLHILMKAINSNLSYTVYSSKIFISSPPPHLAPLIINQILSLSLYSAKGSQLLFQFWFLPLSINLNLFMNSPPIRRKSLAPVFPSTLYTCCRMYIPLYNHATLSPKSWVSQTFSVIFKIPAYCCSSL